MTGLDRLLSLAARVEAIGKAEFMTHLSEKLSEEALEQVDVCFRQERDPYWNAWEPNKDGHKIGQVTGHLRRSWYRTHYDASAFRIESSAEYAPYFQYGSGNSSPRYMVPVREKGLGPFWKAAFDRIAIKALQGALK